MKLRAKRDTVIKFAISEKLIAETNEIELNLDDFELESDGYGYFRELQKLDKPSTPEPIKTEHSHNYVQDQHSTNQWVCSRCGDNIFR